MAYDLEQIFETLPALHRLRDHAEGRLARGAADPDQTLQDPADFGPLKSLLSVMMREGQIVEADIAQLYNDHFIETCAEDMIPYIGALIGAQPLEDIGEPQSARQWVALTLALRQRKGTLAALEFAARAATGWPVVAVEYWQRVVVSESLRRVRRAGGTADLRNISALSRAQTAFDTTPHSAEFGRIGQGTGRWNLPNIGLHFCRLKATALGTDNGNHIPGHEVRPAFKKSRLYRFSPFGADQPLFQRPSLAPLDINRRATERDLPIAITRQMLADAPEAFTPHSFYIHVITRRQKFMVPFEDFKVANLASRPARSGKEIWAWPARRDKVLIDPERGRFILPTDGKYRQLRAVHVYWHHGRAHDIGSYERPESHVPLVNAGDQVFADSTRYLVEGFDNITPASGGHRISFTGLSSQIVALAGASPTIDLGGKLLRISCMRGSKLLVSGLRFFNGRVLFEGEDVSIRMEDCTFAQKGALNQPVMPTKGPPVISVSAGQSLKIVRSICGRIQLEDDAALHMEDSVVQAKTLGDFAISTKVIPAGQRISLNRCTVLGRVAAFAVAEGVGISDSLLVSNAAHGVFIKTVQQGCVRFTRLPENARVPKRFHCLQAPFPRFVSTDLRHPAYMQLAADTPAAILSGGENGAEMGVGNRQNTRARFRNLTRTTEEFLRFGYAAGPIFEN